MPTPRTDNLAMLDSTRDISRAHPGHRLGGRLGRAARYGKREVRVPGRADVLHDHVDEDPASAIRRKTPSGVAGLRRAR